MPIKLFRISGEKATLQKGNVIGYAETDYSPGIQILHFFRGDFLYFYFRGKKGNVLLTVLNCQLSEAAFNKKAKKIAAEAGYDIIPLARKKFSGTKLKWAYKVV